MILEYIFLRLFKVIPRYVCSFLGWITIISSAHRTMREVLVSRVINKDCWEKDLVGTDSEELLPHR
jgi:hypothetical protein